MPTYRDKSGTRKWIGAFPPAAKSTFWPAIPSEHGSRADRSRPVPHFINHEHRWSEAHSSLTPTLQMAAMLLASMRTTRQVVTPPFERASTRWFMDPRRDLNVT